MTAKELELARVLREALLLIRTKPKVRLAGICGSLNGVLLRWEYSEVKRPLRALLIAYMNRWPEHSGVEDYPIKSGDDTLVPDQKFKNAVLDRKLWDRRTTYGCARWDLLNFVICEVKRDIQLCEWADEDCQMAART